MASRRLAATRLDHQTPAATAAATTSSSISAVAFQPQTTTWSRKADRPGCSKPIVRGPFGTLVMGGRDERVLVIGDVPAQEAIHVAAVPAAMLGQPLVVSVVAARTPPAETERWKGRIGLGGWMVAPESVKP